MTTLMVLYGPPSDPAAFRDHYETTHLPLAEALPGATAMRYSLDVAAAEGDSPYAAVFEADFADGAALDAALASPEGQAAQADVPAFATGGVTILVLG